MDTWGGMYTWVIYTVDAWGGYTMNTWGGYTTATRGGCNGYPGYRYNGNKGYTGRVDGLLTCEDVAAAGKVHLCSEGGGRSNRT